MLVLPFEINGKWHVRRAAAYGAACKLDLVTNPTTATLEHP